MKRTSSRHLHTRAAAILVASTAAVASLAWCTTDGLAASGLRGGTIRSALEIYDVDFFISNTEYGSVETGQTASFATSIGPVVLVGLNLDAPTDPSQMFQLPAPGTPPFSGTAEQHVVARMLFGPGSEPFVIDSFFDITYRVANVGSSEFGPFEVELLAMNLTGTHPTYGPVMIRESPTLASTGEHTIEPIPGTTFARFTSFFDVFTELSLDGGMSWHVASESFRVGYVPEPGTIVLAIAGLLGSGFFARRKRGHR